MPSIYHPKVESLEATLIKMFISPSRDVTTRHDSYTRNYKERLSSLESRVKLEGRLNATMIIGGRGYVIKRHIHRAILTPRNEFR